MQLDLSPGEGRVRLGPGFAILFVPAPDPPDPAQGGGRGHSRQSPSAAEQPMSLTDPPDTL